MHKFGHKNLGCFSNRPVTVCLTALFIINKTRSHDVFNDRSTGGGVVVYKFICTAGISEKLGSSFKPTVANSLLENQTREIEYHIETGISNFQ
jgi:hypothetical protein